VRVTLRRAACQPTADGGEDGEELWAIIDDDGPGIPPHALERIFERFYTDRPEQGFGQNSGLGLSISRQIVEAHGGRIWAENRPGTLETANDEETTRHGAGARFVVVLPAIVP
jgi:two-component system sensor histidine kinase ChvG